MENENMQIEENVEELVSCITKEKDPLQEEISSLQDEKRAKENDKKDKEQQIAAAKTDKPKEPEAQLGNWAAGVFGAWGVVLVILFVLHCIVWCLRHLFDISWNTWGWTTTVFWWGLGISVAVCAIRAYLDYSEKQKYEEQLSMYEAYVALRKRLTPEIKKLNTEIDRLKELIDDNISLRCKALWLAIAKGVGVPYPAKKIDSNDAYLALKPEYLKLHQIQQDFNQATDMKEKGEKRKDFMDAKLDFLYRCSLKAEISPEVYEEFSRQYKKKDADLMVLRHDVPQSTSTGVKEISMLPEYRVLLDNNAMQPIVDKMDIIKQRDTKGFLGIFQSNDKKTEQTKDMKMLVTVANKEYQEFMKVHKKVMYALNFARGCAYRNIYLGVELLNYVRDTTAGGKLTTVSDGIGLEDVDMKAVQIDVKELKANTSGAAMNALQGLSDVVFDNDILKDLAFKNPKFSAGVAVLTTIGGGVMEYFSKLSANADAQEELVNTFSTITEGYAEGQANAIRAIEIIKSIVKANDGFMAIYNPLRKKHLEEGRTDVDKMDFSRLAKAMMEYRKITESKL